jgi:hypothetical protein
MKCWAFVCLTKRTMGDIVNLSPRNGKREIRTSGFVVCGERHEDYNGFKGGPESNTEEHRPGPWECYPPAEDALKLRTVPNLLVRESATHYSCEQYRNQCARSSFEKATSIATRTWYQYHLAERPRLNSSKRSPASASFSSPWMKRSNNQVANDGGHADFMPAVPPVSVDHSRAWSRPTAFPEPHAGLSDTGQTAR